MTSHVVTFEERTPTPEEFEAEVVGLSLDVAISVALGETLWRARCACGWVSVGALSKEALEGVVFVHRMARES